MTDDNNNDRMDRADRIREMREGRRRGGDDTAESDTTDQPASTTDETSTGATNEGASVTDGAGETEEPTTDQSATETAEATETADKQVAHDEKTEKTTVEAGQATGTQSAGAGTVSNGSVSTSSGTTFAIPEQATTVTESDSEATIEAAEQSVAAARAAASRSGTAHVGSRTRVLEFDLGDERFCLDIDYIEEIVELENMTRVPNSPSYVEGVVDLRGQVTTIINPKDALNVSNEGQGNLIIVFDSEAVGDQGHLGWVVDQVRQVTPVSDEEVNKSPDEDAEHINGIINRDDEEDFVVWTTPELALETDGSSQSQPQSQ